MARVRVLRRLADLEKAPRFQRYLFFTRWMVAGLSDEADTALLQLGVPFAVELHDCSGLGGRNIIYLDGHVSFHVDGEWELIVEPYSRN